MPAKGPYDTCTLEGCDRPFKASGMCAAHYQAEWMVKQGKRPPGFSPIVKHAKRPRIDPPNPTAWMDRIACKGVNTDDFVNDGTAANARRFAEQYCRVCPVSRECLEFGLRTSSGGVFGGQLLRPWYKKRKRMELLT